MHSFATLAALGQQCRPTALVQTEILNSYWMTFDSDIYGDFSHSLTFLKVKVLDRLHNILYRHSEDVS